jgi:hypothetical protein
LRAKADDVAISTVIMIATSVRTSILISPADFPPLCLPRFSANVKAHLAAFDKVIEARLLSGLDMHKHNLAAGVRRNKALTLVVTSNPFSVNGKQFPSRNRECSAICATGAARHRPCAPRAGCRR